MNRSAPGKLGSTNPVSAVVLIGLRWVGLVNLFMLWGRMRGRLPWGDAVRNVTIWGERVLSLNQRRSVIAEQHQRGQKPKNEYNGLPRN